MAPIKVVNKVSIFRKKKKLKLFMERKSEVIHEREIYLNIQLESRRELS